MSYIIGSVLPVLIQAAQAVAVNLLCEIDFFFQRY